VKGVCPACARRIAPDRVIVKRLLGSHPVDPLAPAIEAACGHCLTLAGFEGETASHGQTLCESGEALRAIERFRRAAADERLESELDLWRESRALDVPEVFQHIERLFTGTQELVADAILLVAVERHRGSLEIVRSGRTRVHESTAPALLMSNDRESRFVLPMGLRLAATGCRLSRVLLQRPRLPFPARQGKRQHGLPATLLAAPALLRPAS
jgi:hypothetical protein